jgi:catechol 2,3-dioxygenase-like lactoylglutathione lyase family enzyme
MLDHVGIAVADYARSKDFFTAALKPLGITQLMEFPGTGGFGEDGNPYFWISGTDQGARPCHIAFAARDRAAVDAFHAAALAAGGTDNGPPGLRAYHTHYYAAFVYDPDDNNIEAVCHLPG